MTTVTATGSASTPTNSTPDTGATTSTTSTPVILDSKGQLNTNTQLYMDYYNAHVSKANVQKLLGTANTQPDDIRKWQDKYETDVNAFKNDLNHVINTYTDTDINHPGTLQQVADKTWAKNQLGSINDTFGAVSLFVDPITTGGPATRMGANAFPGGTQDDHSGIFADSLKKGYVPPPAIDPKGNIKDVYENLTDDQAGYLGWALQQGVQGKELTLPENADRSDLQKWNALATYASQNNKQLTDSSKRDGNPVGIDDYSVPANASTDDKVYTSFWYNRPQNLGSILTSGLAALGQALDPVGPVANAIGGFGGEMTDLVGNIAATMIPGAGEARFAGMELTGAAKAAATGGAELGRVDAGAINKITGLVEREIAPGVLPLADATADVSHTTTGGQYAYLDALKDAASNSRLDSLADAANTPGNTLGTLSKTKAYEEIYENFDIAAGQAAWKDSGHLSDADVEAVRKYTSDNAYGDGLIGALDKLPRTDATAYRFGYLSEDTMGKLKAGKAVTTEDLTTASDDGNPKVMSTSVGIIPGQHNREGKVLYVIDSGEAKDGPTWVAPGADGGFPWQEREAVFYDGTYTFNGAKQVDTSSGPVWQVFLTHHA